MKIRYFFERKIYAKKGIIPLIKVTYNIAQNQSFVKREIGSK